MKTFIAIVIFILSTFWTTATNAQQKPESVVTEFYNWYINKAYKNPSFSYQTPQFRKISETQFEFDSGQLSKRLSSVKYFSKSFVKRLLDNLEACNREMRAKKWDHEPEPEFNIRQCDYLWFDNWVGGQGEKINGFRVIDSRKTANEEFEFLVQIMISNKAFSKTKINVVKEGTLYKIDRIDLMWD